ncbi:MAG: diacylglycerol/lipid kinase family protein [Actinomycetota bacterium]
MNVLLIANPEAGSARDVELSELRDALGSLGEVSISEGGDEAVIVRDADGVDAVVVAGGDGSFNLAVNALGERLEELVFGLLPMGTGNDLARTLGIPEDPIEAAGALSAERTHGIDLGLVTSDDFRRFFVNACMGGFPVRVDEAVDHRTKGVLGPAAFWWGGIKAATDIERTTVTVNGREVNDCVAVGVGNGRTCGGGIEVWPGAVVNDQLLDFAVLPAGSNVAALQLAAKVKGGSHLELEDVVYGRDKRIYIESIDPIPFNADGELFDLSTPLTFEVVGSLKMFASSG